MSSSPSPEIINAARAAYEYLSAVDEPPTQAADVVIGFGTFDLQLATYCGTLYAEGRARRIVFTGGVGAGSADLGQPEAVAWLDELRRSFPQIPMVDVLIETRSTNTAENVRFTAAMLAAAGPDWAIGSGVQRALIVASPSRLRRVKLTLQHLQPELVTHRSLPPSSFGRERHLYEEKGFDYFSHLTGELDRLATYPARGWIAAVPLPASIAAAHALLRSGDLGG
ncbi:MAG: YdcF family protein [Opitutus sp.]